MNFFATDSRGCTRIKIKHALVILSALRAKDLCNSSVALRVLVVKLVGLCEIRMNPWR